MLKPYVGQGSVSTTFFGRFLTGFWVGTNSFVDGAVNAFCCGGSRWEYQYAAPNPAPASTTTPIAEATRRLTFLGGPAMGLRYRPASQRAGSSRRSRRRSAGR